MSTNMEIDEPLVPSKGIEFHPLAIVHMADQYTRITTGGSPLPATSPVVGLLFGTTDDDDEEWQVLDADDISTDISDMQQQQVSLHQAVFPQHKVVGWYRVTTDSEPIPEDLETTQKLRQHFSSSSNRPLIFCFCQLKKTENNTSENNDTAQEDFSDMLPITLYQVDPETGVLLAMEDWKLETSEPERIAVETVLRQKPKEESGFISCVNSMESATEKMKDRLNTLIMFLEDTESGKLPFHPRLMRQVQSVVSHLGLLMVNKPPEKGVEDWLPHMAVAAKTVKAVRGYTEKVKLIQEHRATRRF